MARNYREWNNILSEPNDFSCKIEFLESEMRDILATRKILDTKTYLKSIKKLVNEHEDNLSLCPSTTKLKMFSDSNKIYNSKTYREICNSQVAK